MVPWRAHSGEPTKRDRRHVWGFRTSTRTSAWKRSRALRTRQQRVCGWSHYFGPESASIGRLPRQMTDDSPPMRSSMRTARRCHYCHFSSRPTTECPDNKRVIPVPAYVISKILAIITGTTVTNCWVRRQERLYSRATSSGTIQRHI